MLGMLGGPRRGLQGLWGSRLEGLRSSQEGTAGVLGGSQGPGVPRGDVGGHGVTRRGVTSGAGVAFRPRWPLSAAVAAPRAARPPAAAEEARWRRRREPRAARGPPGGAEPTGPPRQPGPPSQPRPAEPTRAR